MLRKQRRNVKLCQRSARTSARLPRFMQRTIDWGTAENLPQCTRWRFERIVADEWITQAWERIKQTFPQTPPILLEVVTHHQRMGQPSSSSFSLWDSGVRWSSCHPYSLQFHDDGEDERNEENKEQDSTLTEIMLSVFCVYATLGNLSSIHHPGYMQILIPKSNYRQTALGKKHTAYCMCAYGPDYITYLHNAIYLLGFIYPCQYIIIDSVL